MYRLRIVSIVFLALFTCFTAFSANLWELAKANQDVHRYSTIFIASVVRDQLGNEDGLQKAIDFCKQTGITRVFIETFRDGYTAERKTLEHARDRFRDAGIEASGCVTPTGMGTKSTGWDAVSNYEAQDTRDELKRIFAYTASMFDEIMIDDFLFTDDESEQSKKAKGERSWSQYRADLMYEISEDYILKPARAANPDVKVIIKYPQWYDNFHNRGYDVDKQTQLYDKIWVGTETRDPDNDRWGRKAQYEAFFIMSWLNEIGGDKCGGGWFDTYGTSPETYVEQARQTILGGGRESMLFHYGELLKRPELVDALRAEMENLFELARMIHGAKHIGALAVKVPNSQPRGDDFIYDFIGMLGIHLIPAPTIDHQILEEPVVAANQQEIPILAAVLAASSWCDELPEKINDFLKVKQGVVITSNLATLMKEKGVEVPGGVYVLDIPKEPRDLYNLPEDKLNAYRDALSGRFFKMRGPSKVATYLYSNKTFVIENFNDEEVEVTFQMMHVMEKPDWEMALPKPDSVKFENDADKQIIRFTLEPRSLFALMVN
ncbi:hypothetical protein K8I31_10250 [bacterium]|nr:hypothetical protein [bacterium]